ncbi:hypothetical protein [Streptomyces sp. NPDC058326]|uniref:hypothetical protein n=1 Tax=Streptomyces sp. NPDC058326 TaxID=3346447 RepID=UPI0036E4821D
MVEVQDGVVRVGGSGVGEQVVAAVAVDVADADEVVETAPAAADRELVRRLVRVEVPDLPDVVRRQGAVPVADEDVGEPLSSKSCGRGARVRVKDPLRSTAGPTPLAGTAVIAQV